MVKKQLITALLLFYFIHLRRYPLFLRGKASPRSTMCRRIRGLDVESDRPHQLQRIAPFDGPLAQRVVERQFVAFHVVDEVHVGARRPDVGGDLGQRQVVRGDHPDGSGLEQRPDHRGGARAAVAGVGAVEDLVEQEQDRPGPAQRSTMVRNRRISA